MEMLSMKKSALEYLDQTGNLESIKQQCQCQVMQQKRMSVYRLVIRVYPSDVLDLNVDLGSLVLHSPSEARRLFQEVIHQVISTLNLLPFTISCSQVLAVVRLLGLPPVPEYLISSYYEVLKKKEARHFVQLEGVIIGRTVVSKYTQSAKYLCPLKTCSAAESNRYIRLHVPGAREFQTVRKDFNCMSCGSILQEDVNCRVLADKVVIELVSEDALNKTNSARRTQAISVYIRDELVENIDIGKKCCVVGLPWHDTSVGKLAIEANNVIDGLQNYNIPSLQSLSLQILTLHEDRKVSPWSFALSLAYTFAGRITPPGTYLHLKLGLLLSLMGSSEKEGKLDVIAVGNDTLALHRLLQFAVTLADRNISHSNGFHLVAGVSKDRYDTGTCFIDGGSLLLADSGICFLGNVGVYKKTIREALQKALESRQVAVDVPARFGGVSNHQLFLPLKCRVWGYVDTAVHNRKPQISVDPYMQEDISNISKPLADVFGMTYFANVEADSNADHCSIYQTLSDSLTDGQDCGNGLTHEELKQFIRYASHQTPSFSGAAEKLITGYYVASRRARSTSVSSTQFPATALQILSSLAEAHAKLCLNAEVCDTDALMAILLYEEAVSNRYGYSVLNIKAVAHIKDSELDNYIGLKNDERMYQFHHQLKRFIAIHDSSSSFNVEE